MTLQALPPNMGINIDNFISSNVDNYDDVRGYTMTSNKHSSRTVSMFSSKILVNYTTRMKQLNNVSDKAVFKEPVDSLQLSYTDENEIQVSRATNHENRIYLQYGNTNVPVLKSTPLQYVGDDVINI